jgi:hypothetical protein
VSNREPLFAIVYTDAGRPEIVPAPALTRRARLMKLEHAKGVLAKLLADYCEACRANQIEVDFGSERGAA